MEALSLGDIGFEGLPAGKVLDFSLRTCAGEHGYCHVVLEVCEETDDVELLSWQQHEVNVYGRGQLIFAGMVTESNCQYADGRKVISLVLHSLSWRMDIKRRSRTFQAVDKTLEDVAREVAQEYHAQVKVGDNPVISRMLYQNDETDWMFLRRLCEGLGLMLFCDSSSPALQLSLSGEGFKDYKLTGQEIQHGYHISYLEVRRRQENTKKQSRVDEFLDQKIITYDLLPGAGYGLTLANRAQVVLKSRIGLQGDFLENWMLIRHKEGVCTTAAKQRKCWNRPCYIPGKILDVQGQQVKMQFDCDENQDKEKARWITHENTVNNYMYSMPDVGDKAYTYFEECGELVALGSQRGDLDGNTDYQNPENRSLTSENQMIQFQPDRTVCIAGRESSDSSQITGDTSTGIEIISSENIDIQKSEEITIQAKAKKSEDEASALLPGYNKGYNKYIEAGGIPVDPTYGLIDNSAILGKEQEELLERLGKEQEEWLESSHIFEVAGSSEDLKIFDSSMDDDNCTSTICIKSEHYLKFAVQNSQMIVNANSKTIYLQAKIMNQEGYKHEQYANEVKTSAELQTAQSMADLKALARAAFFVGSFIPCPPLQIACAVGSVALDLSDAYEASKRGDATGRNWGIAMACLDAIPLMKTVPRVAGMASRAGEAAKSGMAGAREMAAAGAARAGEMAAAGAARAGKLAATVEATRAARALRPAGEAVIDTMKTFRSWGGSLRAVQKAQQLGTQVIDAGRTAIPAFVAAHPNLLPKLKAGRRWAVQAGKRFLTSKGVTAVRLGVTGVVDYRYNDKCNREKLRKDIADAEANAAKTVSVVNVK